MRLSSALENREPVALVTSCHVDCSIWCTGGLMCMRQKEGRERWLNDKLEIPHHASLSGLLKGSGMHNHTWLGSNHI